VDLSSWPEGSRAIVRGEEPHPGAQLNLLNPERWRHQVLIADSVDAGISYLPGPSPGPCPQSRTHIRNAKGTGLAQPAFAGLGCSATLVELVLMAGGTCSPSPSAWSSGVELAKAGPRRGRRQLRHMILHMAGRITRGSRQVTLGLQHTWRWAAELAAAFTRPRALPLLS